MSTMSQLGEFLATIQNQQDARTAALEQRLATLESKEECGCGSYDELLASYEERISALEGNTGGNTGGEGEGGSTEGEGGSTEPIPASQALEEYNHLIGFKFYENSPSVSSMLFMSMVVEPKFVTQYGEYTAYQQPGTTVTSLFEVNEGDIVKVYTPDLQEIEIIADATQPHHSWVHSSTPMAVGNKETKEVYCYNVDTLNMVVSPCTDEEFIAQWGNSDALGL